MKIGNYELTKEMEHERKQGISFVERQIAFAGEPTYSFNVGDEVAFGGMNKSVVTEILFDGKAYGLMCTCVRNKNRNEKKVEDCYRVTLWHNVRPLGQGDTHFTRNQDMRMYFNNSTIESLMCKHFHFGVDFAPDYQRGYVWSDADKEYLLDSVFSNIEIGKFVFIKRDFGSEYTYEVLDGKQRLSTLIDFYQNRISYKGFYFNDLSFEDRRTFMEHPVVYCDISDVDENTKLKYFVMLNRAGKVMDTAHLNEIEAKIK